LKNSSLSGNTATVIDYVGGSFGAGIYNDSQGIVTVQDSSSITANLSDWYGDWFNFDVDNLGVLYQDGTSTIGALYGNPAIPLAPIPRVIGVQVGGTGWSPSFLTALQTAGDGNGKGYTIPAGSTAQLAPLPWGNLNQIQITFNEGVNIQQSSLTLSGINVAN